VFCTTYKNLVYKLLCLLFYIIFYLCPFCLTGSITLEPLKASKYCTILWIRNGINCFLQLLIYYLCTLGFACFYNASTVPAISEDCVCCLILIFTLFPSARVIKKFTTAFQISLIPAISEDRVCCLILIFYPFPFSKGDKKVHNCFSNIINRAMHTFLSFSGLNLCIIFPQNQVEDKLYIYLEYVSGGSIHKLLQEYGQLGEPAIRSYTQQILSGLAYLHAKNTVHR